MLKACQSSLWICRGKKYQQMQSKVNLIWTIYSLLSSIPIVFWGFQLGKGKSPIIFSSHKTGSVTQNFLQVNFKECELTIANTDWALSYKFDIYFWHILHTGNGKEWNCQNDQNVLFVDFPEMFIHLLLLENYLASNKCLFEELSCLNTQNDHSQRYPISQIIFPCIFNAPIKQHPVLCWTEART